MIGHHPPDDWLASWAFGSADEAVELLVATHLALCPSCRRVAERWEKLGGAWLEEWATAGEVPDVELLLARLDEAPPRPVPPPAPAGAEEAPLPLRRYTGPLADVPFRRTAPGIWRWDLPMSSRERPVALVSVRARMRVPVHRHAATERGLVLTGGYSTAGGHFGRGDVEVRGPEDPEPHRQTIDPGPRCVILMVDDGPKVPVDLVGRLLVRLFERSRPG